MSIIAWLVVGLIAGRLAGMIMKGGDEKLSVLLAVFNTRLT